jgi:hypothetical protein
MTAEHYYQSVFEGVHSRLDAESWRYMRRALQSSSGKCFGAMLDLGCSSSVKIYTSDPRETIRLGFFS